MTSTVIASKGFTVLDWTKDPEVVAYLKSKGAKQAAEIRGEPTKPEEQAYVLEEVNQNFRGNFGELTSAQLSR